MDNCLDPRRMYTQIPSALATPPQSPTDEGWPPNQAAAMPLVTDLLARNGQMNVPPGFVLCIPCFLCKQPFNDIETFKEHLTQHATEIHAWQSAREQLPQEPPQPQQPLFRPFLQPMGQPMGPPAGPYIPPMEFPPQQPSRVSIPGPSQPQMAFPMPPMPFPMQRPHHLMGVQPPPPPPTYPGHCPVHQPQQMEFSHQQLHRSLPQTPQSPLEMMENQFGLQKMRGNPPPPHHPAMQLQPNPHFRMQHQVLPPAELTRLLLQKPIEVRDQHQPREQPPQFSEKIQKDQLPIEARLRMPPSMELQRIVLQKPLQQPVQSPIEASSNRHFPMEQAPQSPKKMREPIELQRIVLQKAQQPVQLPIEASNRHFPMEQATHSIEKMLEHPFQKGATPIELQRIVLQKPQPPLQSPVEASNRHFPMEQAPATPIELQRIVLQKPQQSPIEAKELNLPVEPPQPQSPEKEQFSHQQPLSISPPKELQPSPQELQSPPSMRGRFQCEWCGKRLSSRQSVRYHQSRFHLMDDPPSYKIGKNVPKHFKCGTCKKRYKRRTFLLMHMKIKHGIYGREAASADALQQPAEVESPVEVPASPEGPASPTSSEEGSREVWSTKVFNAVAAASYSPATEPAAKYVNAPRQQPEELESEFAAKPKRVYPMRSPFFNPDLWLDCDAYF